MTLGILYEPLNNHVLPSIFSLRVCHLSLTQIMLSCFPNSLLLRIYFLIQ